MDELTRRRLAHNERLFRAVNRERELADAEAPSDRLAFVCECSDQACHGRIRLAVAEYDRIRRSTGLFVVLPGHEVPEIESVVEEHDGYDIVLKRVA